jgi:hypothetical protein
MLLMSGVRRHYERIFDETSEPSPANLHGITQPMVVLPIDRWSRIAEKALRFAYSISPDIWVVQIATDEDPKPGNADLKRIWNEYIETPAKEAGLRPPRLILLHSPYRMVVTPIFEYVLQVERQNPDRYVGVLVPELVERRWFHY